MSNTRRSGQIIAKGKEKWLVRIFRGRDVAGRKLYHSKVIYGNKSDAQKYLTAKQRQQDTGAFVETSKQTLDEHLDNWLASVKARVAEQTYTSYETLLRVHVRPALGYLRLTSIKINDVQAMLSTMQKNDLSPRTVRYAHAVLSMAMRKAIELDYLIKNPCDFVELPRQIREETRAMSPSQATEFLRAASADQHGLVFELALVTGMRPEEYLGLFWSDVDLNRGVVSVKRALVWLKGGFKFGEPKTKGSRRSIPLPGSLLAKLKKHRREQLEKKLKLGTAYSNIELVFATALGTPIHYRNLTQRHYVKILKVAGLEGEGFVLYSLRHTCATLLLAAGENPKVVSERLGHASVKMTLDTYSHVLPDMQRSASERLDKMLYG